MVEIFTKLIFSYNARTIDYDYMIITVSGSYNYNDNVNFISLPAATNTEVPNNTACETSGKFNPYLTRALSAAPFDFQAQPWKFLDCPIFSIQKN